MDGAHGAATVSDGSFSGSPVTVPSLYCPFPRAVHPQADALEEGTLRWLERFDHLGAEEEPTRSARFGLLCALACPTGEPEAVRLLADLVAWLFLTDDSHIEEPAARGDLPRVAEHALSSIRVLRDPGAACGDLSCRHRALRDISVRLRPMATADQLERITSGLIEYFMSVTCEATYLSARATPTVADYAALRDSSSALSVCFVFGEIAAGLTLPAEVRNRPGFQALVASAIRVVAIAHDILSGPRELSRPFAINLPLCLMDELGLSAPEAFTRAAALHDAETRRFVALADRLLADGPGAGVERYVDGLRTWIRGNYDWSRLTDRYRLADPLLR